MSETRASAKQTLSYMDQAAGDSALWHTKLYGFEALRLAALAFRSKRAILCRFHVGIDCEILGR
eukprot:1995784-Rhodomonas_salina.1